ncbi:MAG: sensor histidine kinase [Woeseiaceae bacterium]|nr:sensor histidine kinase [Woeseiaceae bacterium]
MTETAENVNASLLEKWRPFRGPFTRWPRLSDALLALISFFLTMAIWSGEQAQDDVSLPFGAFVLFVLGNASLYWRRRRPERVHGVILATSALAMLLGYLRGPIFATAISLYNVGRYTANDRDSAIGLTAAYVLLIISEIAFQGLSSEDIITLTLPFVFWYTGRRVRARGEYLRILRERADQLERERLVEAERAVAEERTRIARELHDIVAHQVSLMTVQAGAAKTIAGTDPAAAAKAIGSIEVAGRQALDELRHLLGVLRPDAASDEMGPQPGRADLPRLIEEVELAGLEVSLTQDAGQRRLPARIELAIYRIVQEALTNVLKHAGPGTRADVRIRADECTVTIEIKDNGVEVIGSRHSGHGIAGMRERAYLLGGTLQAGPQTGGGFSVVARLPTAEEVA